MQRSRRETKTSLKHARIAKRTGKQRGKHAGISARLHAGLQHHCCECAQREQCARRAITYRSASQQSSCTGSKQKENDAHLARRRAHRLAGGAERREVCNELLDRIQDSMRSVLVSAPDYETLLLIHTARRLYQRRGLQSKEKQDLARRFAEGYKMLLLMVQGDPPQA